MVGSSRRVLDRSYGEFGTCYAGNPCCYGEFGGCYTVFDDCYKFRALKIASATSSAPTVFFAGRLSLCYGAEFKKAAVG
jgi:hypothetical protein